MPGYFEVEKDNNIWSGWHKKEDLNYVNIGEGPSREDDMKKKNKTHEPSTLGDTQIFMQSILDELKLARENMFIWMREEMRKIMDDTATAPKPTTKEEDFKHETNRKQDRHNVGFVSSVQHFDHASAVGSVKRRKTFDSQMSNGVVKNKVGYGEITGSTNSADLDRGEASGLCIKKPTTSVNPNHVGSSTQYTYLTLPTVLPETYVENQKFDYLSGHSFGMANVRNRHTETVSQTSAAFETSIPHGSFPETLQEEKIKYISPMGSQGISHIAQKKLMCSSNIGNGFPVLQCHNLNGTVKIQTGVGTNNLSQVQNILGSRINEGARSIGRGYGLSDFNVNNRLSSYGNSKADDAWVQSNLITRAQSGAVIHEMDVYDMNS